MAMDKKTLLAKADKLERALPKLTGKKKMRAKNLMYSLRHRAKLRDESPTKIKVAKMRKPKVRVVDPNQGVLPGFTDLVTPQISELARDIVFKALRKSMENAVDEVVRKLKVV